MCRLSDIFLSLTAAAYVCIAAAADDLPRGEAAEATFDPKAAGWQLVFSDDFDAPQGAAPDSQKWFVPSWRGNERLVRHDGQGRLAVTVDYKPGTTNLVTSAIWSRESWCYGYFEARVRFTRNNGWWSSFWLYGSMNRNASEDGSEIDIAEDYYTRTRRWTGREAPFELDHNIRASFGDVVKNYNIRSQPAGSLDDFHVVACKWTPLGVAFYLDGRLLQNAIYSPRETNAVFSAFSSVAVRAPLHVVFSGQVFDAWGARDLTGIKFPESFLIDWVRVWRMPEGEVPSVSWSRTDDRVVRVEGETIPLDVSVDATNGVEGVYLFDNGCFIAQKKEPPWSFRVPFSRVGYAKTRFARPGLFGGVPDWERLLHSFTVYVRDRKGKVGVTRAPQRYLSQAALRAATPFDKVLTHKGRVRIFVSKAKYFGDTTGSVRAGEINVSTAGVYRCRLRYRAGGDSANRVLVLLDGERIATISCPRRRPNDWNMIFESDPVELALPQGRHNLALVLVGYVKYETLDLEPSTPAAVASEKWLAPPADYAAFPRSVERLATYDCGDFDVELYSQANGPATRQRVMMAVPRGLSGRAPAVVVPYYFPEAALGFNPATKGLDAPQVRAGTNLAEYAEIAFMADLARRGYVAISADAYYLTYPKSASSGSWDRWREAGEALARDWPTWTGLGKLLFDTTLLVDLLEGDSRVDPSRIGMMGHSLGGKMAFCAGMVDRRVKAVVASDFGIGWDQSNWRDVWYMGRKADAARAEGFDATTLLDLSGGTPFCLLAGKFDDESSAALVRRSPWYRDHPDDFLFLNHAAGHRPPRSATQKAYEFLDRHLKPQEGARALRTKD